MIQSSLRDEDSGDCFPALKGRAKLAGPLRGNVRSTLRGNESHIKPPRSTFTSFA